jgi:hypothetical protein
MSADAPAALPDADDPLPLPLFTPSDTSADAPTVDAVTLEPPCISMRTVCSVG